VNYGQLKTFIIARAHRPDKLSQAGDFIREAEGLIRVKLDAYPLSTTLTDANRSGPTSPRYTLPSGLRRITQVFSSDGIALVKSSRTALPPTNGAGSTRIYADYGTSIIVAGVPGAGTSLALEYMGVPSALTNDVDVNALLTDHETLYVEGALFFLRKDIEDDDQAQRHYDLFMAYMDGLNEQYGEKTGGAVTSGGYDFSPRSSY
jgi:hypothetical protein